MSEKPTTTGVEAPDGLEHLVVGVLEVDDLDVVAGLLERGREVSETEVALILESDQTTFRDVSRVSLARERKRRCRG